MNVAESKPVSSFKLRFLDGCSTRGDGRERREGLEGGNTELQTALHYQFLSFKLVKIALRMTFINFR